MGMQSIELAILTDLSHSASRPLLVVESSWSGARLVSALSEGFDDAGRLPAEALFSVTRRGKEVAPHLRYRYLY